MTDLDTKAIVATLNKILEMELAGVVRYTHYSLMVFGYNRIPIVSWLRAQADESLAHAQQAGELVTHLGEHPSLAIGPLLETHQHDIGGHPARVAASTSASACDVHGAARADRRQIVMLEEYAREMISAEELHAGEVDKMLRKPGDIAAYRK